MLDHAFVRSKPSSKRQFHIQTVRWPSRKGDLSRLRNLVGLDRLLQKTNGNYKEVFKTANSAVGRVISEHCVTIELK